MNSLPFEVSNRAMQGSNFSDRGKHTEPDYTSLGLAPDRQPSSPMLIIPLPDSRCMLCVPMGDAGIILDWQPHFVIVPARVILINFYSLLLKAE